MTETTIETKEEATELLALNMLDALREYYDGTDYAEDAMQIAQLVCCQQLDNEGITAERLLNSIGYVVGMLLDWELPPELRARVEQIRRIALPEITPVKHGVKR